MRVRLLANFVKLIVVYLEDVSTYMNDVRMSVGEKMCAVLSVWCAQSVYLRICQDIKCLSYLLKFSLCYVLIIWVLIC